MYHYRLKLCLFFQPCDVQSQQQVLLIVVLLLNIGLWWPSEWLIVLTISTFSHVWIYRLRRCSGEWTCHLLLLLLNSDSNLPVLDIHVVFVVVKLRHFRWVFIQFSPKTGYTHAAQPSWTPKFILTLLANGSFGLQIQFDILQFAHQLLAAPHRVLARTADETKEVAVLSTGRDCQHQTRSGPRIHMGFITVL